MNGGHGLGNQAAQNPAYRRASHTISARKRCAFSGWFPDRFSEDRRSRILAKGVFALHVIPRERFDLRS